MAQDVEIRCINKTNRTDPHERISYLGGVNRDGTGWKLTEDQTIAGIENGKWRFWIQRGEKSIRVIIARSSAGHKYLKTEADGMHPDDLLALRECP